MGSEMCIRDRGYTELKCIKDIYIETLHSMKLQSQYENLAAWKAFFWPFTNLESLSRVTDKPSETLMIQTVHHGLDILWQLRVQLRLVQLLENSNHEATPVSTSQLVQLEVQTNTPHLLHDGSSPLSFTRPSALVGLGHFKVHLDIFPGSQSLETRNGNWIHDFITR